MYNPEEIEAKWQKVWMESGAFATETISDKPKYYVLSMFPYPSGSGLHVGHPLSYTAVDIVARYKRMNGFNVLNPMGWDAFGLPSERAAIRENRHPEEITAENIAYFKHQLLKLGFSFDWSRELATSSEDYYRWTQWIFSKLYERGLAHLADVPVNWCPAQGTVLANEEVVDGKYVETGEIVERRMMKQWMLKITEYAQRLLDDLDELDWPEGVIEMQRQWIGRSEGAEVRFDILDQELSFTVYTTRPDTLFGATYCVLAPESELVSQITTSAQKEQVVKYVEEAKNRSDMERQITKEKTGVFTGAYAINPVNGKQIPIWVADYVLATYGTGSIMAVPAHDERDHEFAKKFSIEIVPVISTPEGHDISEEAWTGDGISINSGDFNGLSVVDFKERIISWLEEQEKGVRKVNYKLRDWLFSRQRYWGEPFPILHTEDGEVLLVPEADLPVSLPFLEEYTPTADGRPPLARAEEWLKVDLSDGRRALRETNTMPQWAGSCWYYLRYIDPHNEQELCSADAVSYWKNVDLYIGGVEHAVLHLLYARFWHKVLFDCGLVPTKEPFQRLFNQGMIISTSYRDKLGKYYHSTETAEKEGAFFIKPDLLSSEAQAKGLDAPLETQVEKMSKSKKNTVDPLDIIAEYGADTLRMYEMFMGPLEQVKLWQTSGCKGIRSFLNKVWRLLIAEDGTARNFASKDSKPVLKALHVAIKETTLGVEALKFNTPISKMMEFVNQCKGTTPSKDSCKTFIKILSPYAPHLSAELWERLELNEDINYCSWPKWDETVFVEDEITVVVQIKGKVRARIVVPADASAEDVLAKAKSHPSVQQWIEGKTIKKEGYIPGKLVFLVPV